MKPTACNLRDVLFSELADTLERKRWCKVYYADDWVDSFYVSVDAQEQEVAQIMATALAGSGFTFIIGRRQAGDSLGRAIRSRQISGKSMKSTWPIARLQWILPVICRREQAEAEENDISEEFRLYKIGNPAEMEKEGKVSLSGTVVYTGSDVPVMGAIVYIRKLQIGASTDANGHYALLLPRGQHTDRIQEVGMKSTIRNLLFIRGEALTWRWRRKSTSWRK